MGWLVWWEAGKRSHWANCEKMTFGNVFKSLGSGEAHSRACVEYVCVCGGGHFAVLYVHPTEALGAGVGWVPVGIALF